MDKVHKTRDLEPKLASTTKLNTFIFNFPWQLTANENVLMSDVTGRTLKLLEYKASLCWMHRVKQRTN
jgi:hypothetical protein